MNLPTKAEWEAAGFSVPPELCRVEPELTPEQWLSQASRGIIPEDPLSDLANEIMDTIQIEFAQGQTWNSVETGTAIEDCIKEFFYKAINESQRRKDLGK